MMDPDSGFLDFLPVSKHELAATGIYLLTMCYFTEVLFVVLRVPDYACKAALRC